ncbi:MAG: hypothetical protein ACTMID_06530, partial [Cellulosimicrobium funkei]
QTAFRRRSLVVVVTDEARPAAEHEQLLLEARPAAEHEQLLRSLRVRHEVMVVQVADLSPVGAGTGEVADVDGTLRLPPFLRGRAALAAPAAEALAARRSEVAERLRALQVEGVLVEGSDDVLQRFVELLGRQKRARR